MNFSFFAVNNEPTQQKYTMCEALFTIGGKSRAYSPVIHSEYCNSIHWNMLFPELEHINTNFRRSQVPKQQKHIIWRKESKGQKTFGEDSQRTL